jgi:glycine hydroxymethyltransferase
VVANAKAMGEAIISAGYGLVTGGTDTHVLLADLRPKGLTGKAAEAALSRANITCNKNAVPFDEQKPFVTSGIRLGSPAGTTRGFGQAEFRQVGRMITEVLDGLVSNGDSGNGQVEERVKREAIDLCERYPIYHQ